MAEEGRLEKKNEGVGARNLLRDGKRNSRKKSGNAINDRSDLKLNRSKTS